MSPTFPSHTFLSDFHHLLRSEDHPLAQRVSAWLERVEFRAPTDFASAPSRRRSTVFESLIGRARGLDVDETTGWDALESFPILVVADASFGLQARLGEVASFVVDARTLDAEGGEVLSRFGESVLLTHVDALDDAGIARVQDAGATTRVVLDPSSPNAWVTLIRWGRGSEWRVLEPSADAVSRWGERHGVATAITRYLSLVPQDLHPSLLTFAELEPSPWLSLSRRLAEGPIDAIELERRIGPEVAWRYLRVVEWWPSEDFEDAVETIADEPERWLSLDPDLRMDLLVGLGGLVPEAGLDDTVALRLVEGIANEMDAGPALEALTHGNLAWWLARGAAEPILSALEAAAAERASEAVEPGWWEDDGMRERERDRDRDRDDVRVVGETRAGVNIGDLAFLVKLAEVIDESHTDPSTWRTIREAFASRPSDDATSARSSASSRISSRPDVHTDGSSARAPGDATHSVTISEAAALVGALASERSVLLLGPPGVGKSAVVSDAARAAGLPLRVLYGTQIGPEDVTGVPRLVGERTVFHPPRQLLPERPEPFALFLDELPASSPDVQRALYPVLLERRVGEHALPRGTWVVAAGNRAEDRAFVRAMSSALLNRLVVIHVRVSLAEWLVWAAEAGVRDDVRDFVSAFPESLLRTPGASDAPFSSPRSWATLSRALDLVERAGLDMAKALPALAWGTVSEVDAARFVAFAGVPTLAATALRELVRDDRPLFDMTPELRLAHAHAIGRAASSPEFFSGMRPIDVENFVFSLQSDGEAFYAAFSASPASWVNAGAGPAFATLLHRAALGAT